MAHKPKIEFYKIKLKRKKTGDIITFRELFREKFSLMGKETNLKGFYDEYSSRLIKELDGEGFHVNEKRKKGYTLFYEELPLNVRETSINLKSKDWVISGILDGGIHGRKRTLSKIGNKNDQQQINTTDIVCDKFFFLLSTPIENTEGIIMIQGYSELKISDIFRDHMKDFFSFNKDIICNIELYIPKELKNKHLNGATFSSVKFTTDWLVTPDFDNIKEQVFDLRVNIEIVDRSATKTDLTKIEALLKPLKQFKLWAGTEKKKQKTLSDFNTSRVKINSNGKSLPIKLENENQITPIIYLEDEGITIDELTLELDFDEVRLFCENLLVKINNEYLPSNAIKEL